MKFVIGDIHGCVDKLHSVIVNADINLLSDTVIFLGDYIDRGPKSNEVISFLIELKNLNKNHIFLMGNHEIMFLSYIHEYIWENFYFQNGGLKTLESYGFKIDSKGIVQEQADIPMEHIDFIKSLKFWHEDDSYIYTHAGLDPDLSLDKQDWDDNIWIRDKWINSDVNFGKRVIFGHTIFSEPYIDNFKIGIDTGSFLENGKITALCLDNMKFYTSGE